jgi:hypothetical protein
METNATIKVGAVFQGDKIVPKWFVWEERKYEVKTVNYNWLDQQGREKLHCFSVSDGTNNYELVFHAEKTIWKLIKVFG